MKKQIEKLLNCKTFFKLKEQNGNRITCVLEKPSQIILNNIYKNWLQSIHSKTHLNFPVYLNKDIAIRKHKNTNSFYGYINQRLPNQITELHVDYNNINSLLKVHSELNYSFTIPQQDIMQYFIQWQRYRKYWWSSITTTPSLFSIVDIKSEDDKSHANVSANFNWGPWIVETIKVTPSNENSENSALLSCKMSLEKCLLTLLLDASSNSTKEEYLRLHNKMAPYKISFALDAKDETHVLTLQDLATQVFFKLLASKITTWLPNFTLPLDDQIKENLQMGVTYTAILTDNTLTNGIFHLLNSSTMLKEQVHLADFVNYAALLCGQRS